MENDKFRSGTMGGVKRAWEGCKAAAKYSSACEVTFSTPFLIISIFLFFFVFFWGGGPVFTSNNKKERKASSLQRASRGPVSWVHDIMDTV